MMDSVSHIAQIKQEDIGKEGNAEAPENTRKAAILSASYTMLSATKRLMEDY